MKTYLVMFHFLQDDFPVRLFDQRDEAEAYIQDAPEQLDAQLERIVGTDASQSMGYSIVTFEGGEPVKKEGVRWFDDESEAT